MTKEIVELFGVIVISLAFGSFFGMLKYRLQNNVSLINPKRSFCVNCKTQIKWYENIPILSYIFLGGRCSYCNKKISFSYIVIEFITATFLALSYYAIKYMILV